MVGVWAIHVQGDTFEQSPDCHGGVGGVRTCGENTSVSLEGLSDIRKA